ncbi:hypothetical protein [Trinickia mobilis]|uniref:hypothetical protein n=1 Tax=Trinickia mobilis TaxID=2816356 RepID=UPI001A8D5836|nr:hypothetical protein [Trinickia mobilis]
MTHQLVDSYPDYAAVLHRTDNQPAKDERFIVRAFLTCGFEDQTSSDDLEFRHIESGTLVTCDGEALALHLSDDEAQLRVSYSDLFLVLRNLEWETASLYCTGDVEDKLHEFASFIPASYDLELSAGVTGTEGEVEGLRQAIAGHAASGAAAGDEPSVRISDLSNSASETKADAAVPLTSGPAVSTDAVARASLEDAPAHARSHAEPVRDVLAPVAEAKALPPHAEGARHFAPSIAAPASRDGLPANGNALVDFLLRANEDYRTQVSELIALVRQLTGGEPQMNRFAAAVLPLDAIVIAHVGNRKAAKLADLGFAQDYNVMAHQEYGVVVDGAFIVFSKDNAPPEWTEMLIGRLGGVISRLWQSDASVVGTVLEQFVAPSPNEVIEQSDGSSKVVEPTPAGAPGAVSDATAAESEPVQQTGERVRSSGNLSVDQEKILDGFMAPLRFALEQVFAVQNEGADLERRVAEIESNGLTVQPAGLSHAGRLNGTRHSGLPS